MPPSRTALKDKPWRARERRVLDRRPSRRRRTLRQQDQAALRPLTNACSTHSIRRGAQTCNNSFVV